MNWTDIAIIGCAIHWLTAFIVVLLILLISLQRTQHLTSVCPSSATVAIGLGALLIVGGAIRLWVVLHVNYVFYDEFYHLDAAYNLHAHQLFALRSSDLVTGSQVFFRPPYDPVFAFLVSLTFNLAEPAPGVVFAFNTVVGTLTILVFFFVGKSIVRRDISALVLAGLLTFYPLHLKFSGGGNLEPTSLFFSGLALVAVLLYRSHYTARTGLLALVAATVAVLTRVENGILAAGIYFFVLQQALHNRSCSGRRWLLAATFALPVLFVLPVIFSRSAIYNWAHLLEEHTVASIFRFLFINPLNTIVLPVVALFGVVVLWKRDRQLSLLLAGSWLFYLAVYTLLRNADTNHADLTRYHVNTSLFQLVFAAAALHWLLTRTQRYGRLVWAALLVIYGASSLGSYDSIVHHYTPDRVAEIDFISAYSESLGDDALICTAAAASPMLRWVAGTPTTTPQQLLAADAINVSTLLYYRRSGFPEQTASEEKLLLSRYDLTLVASQEIGGHTVGFFALQPRDH